MVGPHPPPLHGAAAINVAVRDRLLKAGAQPRTINIGSNTLSRSLAARLKRLPRVLGGVLLLAAMRNVRGGALYLSVSGGRGQAYELLVLAIARIRGLRIFMHHHSFAYLKSPRWLTRWVVALSGREAVHVTLSAEMARRLCTLYSARRCTCVSNSVFMMSRNRSLADVGRRLRVLGFISNLAPEKGVFEFLRLAAEVRRCGLPLLGRLAGPWRDSSVEAEARAQLASLPSVEYLGPKYGKEKDAFLGGIDVLIFPTLYADEAEPVVVHEAMSRGIPVIAYGRGAIPEIVGEECGKVIPESERFVPAALQQLNVWFRSPLAFQAARFAAAQRFQRTYAENLGRWRDLLGELAGRRTTVALD